MSSRWAVFNAKRMYGRLPCESPTSSIRSNMSEGSHEAGVEVAAVCVRGQCAGVVRRSLRHDLYQFGGAVSLNSHRECAFGFSSCKSTEFHCKAADILEFRPSF